MVNILASHPLETGASRKPAATRMMDESAHALISRNTRAVQFPNRGDAGLTATFPYRHALIPSCQDLILASPGTNLADVIKLQVEVPMIAYARRYQGQALV
jgi:hypothetical protein